MSAVGTGTQRVAQQVPHRLSQPVGLHGGDDVPLRAEHFQRHALQLEGYGGLLHDLVQPDLQIRVLHGQGLLPLEKLQRLQILRQTQQTVVPLIQHGGGFVQLRVVVPRLRRCQTLGGVVDIAQCRADVHGCQGHPVKQCVFL